MFDFLTAIPAEWIAIGLFFLASMQGADGTSWLAKLVAKLTSFVAPAAKGSPVVTLFRQEGGAFVEDRQATPAGAIGFQNIIALIIPLIPVLLPLIQGCGATAKGVQPVPVVSPANEANQCSLWEDFGRERGQIVDLGSGGTVGAGAVGVTWVSGTGRAAWAWADGTAGDAGDFDRRRFDATDAGGGGGADRSGVSSVGGGGRCEAAGGRCNGGAVGRATVWAPRAVASAGSRWYPGRRLAGVARFAARPFRWLRLPGRPFARLLGRR